MKTITVCQSTKTKGSPGELIAHVYTVLLSCGETSGSEYSAVEKVCTRSSSLASKAVMKRVVLLREARFGRESSKGSIEPFTHRDACWHCSAVCSGRCPSLFVSLAPCGFGTCRNSRFQDVACRASHKMTKSWVASNFIFPSLNLWPPLLTQILRPFSSPTIPISKTTPPPSFYQP